MAEMKRKKNLLERHQEKFADTFFSRFKLVYFSFLASITTTILALKNIILIAIRKFSTHTNDKGASECYVTPFSGVYLVHSLPNLNLRIEFYEIRCHLPISFPSFTTPPTTPSTYPSPMRCGVICWLSLRTWRFILKRNSIGNMF